MQEYFSVLSADNPCCAGAHHQEWATVPTPQLLSAASLTSSAVTLGRPASRKSGKTSGNYMRAAMIQSTLWEQNKQEQIDSMAREVTSIPREGGSAVRNACLAGRSLGSQVLEDTWNFSRPVTKPVLKACMLFTQPLLYPSGWQDALLQVVVLGYRCTVVSALCKCHFSLCKLLHGDSSKDELSLLIYF